LLPGTAGVGMEVGMRRGLETEQAGHGHGSEPAAGESQGKVAAGPNTGHL